MTLFPFICWHDRESEGFFFSSLLGKHSVCRLSRRRRLHCSFLHSFPSWFITELDTVPCAARRTLCLSVLNVTVCIRQPRSPRPALSLPLLPVLYAWVCSCFTDRFVCMCFRFHLRVMSQGVCLSLSDSLQLVWESLAVSMLPQVAAFRSFYGWVVFHCIYAPHLLYLSADRHLGFFHALAIE